MADDVSGGGELEEDIRKRYLPPLPWDDGDVTGSLHTVYQHVAGNAISYIDWYIASKRPKKTWARRLRVLAIVLTTVAGILPVLSQIGEQNWSFTIAPAWATVVLAVAVALLALDRFFGFSSAWARFIATELAIQTALDQFQIRWQQALVTLPDDAGPDDVNTMLELARQFLAEVDRLVEAETSVWVKEFNESLRQIERRSSQNQSS